MKSISLLFVSVLSLFMAMPSKAQSYNPILPLWEYIPDGEPYVFEDPDNPGKFRVYLYGSHDMLKREYCGLDQVVWSAPVEDLGKWRYDGVIFQSRLDAQGKPLNPNGEGDLLYAPDVTMVTGADGKKIYYLYPNNQREGRKTMVATSNRPDGPFEVCNWHPTNPRVTVGVLGFDPAVFVDDDGKVYGYWGFETSYGGEMDPSTMASLLPGTEAVKDMVSSRKQEGDFRFFEASSMRKIKDKYVFVYSRWTKPGEFGLEDTNYTLAYAYSDQPLGPFVYGGTIIDARGREQQPDGTVRPTATPGGNTHGSILEIGGQWYVFYHRQIGTDEFARQAMVAPITVEVTEGPGGKVVISEGELTSEGFQTAGLDLFQSYPAGIASHYTGPKVSVHQYPNKLYSGSYIKPTYFEGDPTKAPSDLVLRSNPVVNNTSGSIIGYKYFNFSQAPSNGKVDFELCMLPSGIEGSVAIMAVSPDANRGGILLGTIDLRKANILQPVTLRAPITNLNRVHGKQPLYLVITAKDEAVSIGDIYHVGFVRQQ
jgi:hypothetical protein